jgi:4-diphosphocytidyl-2-C-methyl-D-erythritol kinase
VRELAPGKVNLCLFLGGLREDGRHELVTVIESVSLADELELTPLPAGADEVICEGVEGDNLVAGALRALRAAGWEGPPLRVAIRKRVPVAAGMGGGSADAAAMLRAAGRLAPVPEIGPLAAGLGADVPSQLRLQVSLATGAGEEVQTREPLASHALVIVPSPHRLSTADVYAEADRLGLPRSQEALAAKRQRVESALRPGRRLSPELLVNDLEPAAVALCPDVGRALEAVREAGADHAIVCGSGPTVAGLCWGEDGTARAEALADALTDRFPAATAVAPVSSPGSGTISRDR